MRLLRWGTFLLLILIVVGALFSYPILRDRFFSPMLAAQAPDVEQLRVSESAIRATDTQTSTPRPTLSSPTTNATQPSVIIEAPNQTATGEANQEDTPTAESTATTTPVPFATTSLLPNNGHATAKPEVRGPTIAVQERVTPTEVNSVEMSNVVTSSIVVSDGQVLIEIVSPAPTVTEVVGQVASPGQKGYEAPLPSSNALTSTTATITPLAGIPIVDPPAVVTPIVVTTVEITSTNAGFTVTPIVVTTIELTPASSLQAPESTGPVANSVGPLYGAPDFAAPVVGQVVAGEQLTIVGLYTEGTWYLLSNGQWIPGAAVNNAPLTMPLVFPTITPVPTTTPTVTPTPSPTATPLGSPTATPTPTSLDQSVCDCSGDNLDCLGNIFANRAQAQQCFEYCFRQTGKDIHLLDPNVNGMACENLP